MILIDDTLLSTELFDRKFCCDLKACKGACCVEGESGAPLEPEELAEVEAAFPIIKHRLKPDSLAVIEREGLHVVDADGDHVTPIVQGKECVYATFDDDGTAKCAFEQAHLAGEIEWRKPRILEKIGKFAINEFRKSKFVKIFVNFSKRVKN